MRVPKVTLLRVLSLIVFAEVTFCLGLVACISLNKPTRPSTASDRHTAAPFAALSKPKETPQKTVNAGLPMRLRIPKLNLDAALDYVGLTPQGDLDSPKDPARGAWYKQGPRPGDSGNAIIDGHFGYKNHTPAIFDDLHQLRQGDKILVEDDQKIVTAFVVRELREYGPNENAADVFRATDGKSRLNLITCKGTWNKAQKSYSARLVVFADKTVE